jgi:hypothetical protein
MLVGYWPDYTFLERALAEGVWPLWNPHVYAGAPFLKVYPVDLLLVGAVGAPGALSIGVVMHLLLAMCGMTVLARHEGLSVRGSWLAGAVYGLSGFVLSLVTLLQLLQAAAWAPWVAWAFLGVLRQPTGARAARLGLLAALQVTTLAVEIAAQTALVGLILAAGTAPRPRHRQWSALAAAAIVAALLSAPALLGVVDLVAGTRRAGSFAPTEVLALSANGPMLAEALVPRFFGPPLWYGESGGWGHSYFPGGAPYLMSVYLGPAVLGLALLGGAARLWVLVLLGVLLGLGEHGPFAAPLSLLTFLRFPVKYLFLATIGLALLAGRGLDRLAVDGSRFRWMAALPGLLLLAAGIALRIAPERACAVACAAWPPLAGPPGALTCGTIWPEAWLVSGALGAAVGLIAPSRFALLAAPVLVLDLLVANGPINPLVPRGFLALGTEVRALVENVRRRPGSPRIFSYGVALGEGRRWDLPSGGGALIGLHRLMRQSLTQPSHVMDGLDGALDVGRTGWEPAGSTLALSDLRPDRFPSAYTRLRHAGVGFVFSFEPLPADPHRAELVGQAHVEGGRRAIQLYALPDALPRAFWVPRCERVGDQAAAEARLSEAGFDPRQSVVVEGEAACGTDGVSLPANARVEQSRLSPHRLRVTADSPPGFVVVLEGHHSNWRARIGSEPIDLLRANGRYWAVATPGGARVFDFSYEPKWPRQAAASLALGLLAAGLVFARFGRAPE